MTAERDDVPPVERLIELALFAPLSVGARVLAETPKAVTRVRQDLATARFLGEMALNQGVRRLQARVEKARRESPMTDAGEATPPVGPAVVPPATGSTQPGGDTVPSDDEAAVDVDVPSVDDLALPDYEHLPAVDVVAALPGLTPDERAAVERYERAHRRRRTVLGKIDQLGGDGR